MDKLGTKGMLKYTIKDVKKVRVKAKLTCSKDETKLIVQETGALLIIKEEGLGETISQKN